jgi:hypothetical protein
VRRESFDKELITDCSVSGEELMEKGLECVMETYQHGLWDSAIYSLRKIK